jgi:cytochrome c biogenesis protein CcdA/glutaredoxin
MWSNRVFAADNLVNIYFFHSNTCSHCKAEGKLLEELMNDYDNIRIYKYEVNAEENMKLLKEVADLHNTNVSGVPFTVIGDKYFKGFNYDNARPRFMAAIEYYSSYGYKDITGEYIGDIELPSYDIDDNQISVDDYISDKVNPKIKIFGKEIDLKNLTLPVIALLIGLVDGFNPCAMWVLLFLISMLIGMKDRKRMWVLGLSFLLTSAFVYLLFMLAWLNAATLLLSVSYVRIIIGLIALAGAIINLTSYFKHRKDNGCDVIDDKKRNKIFDKIKKFTSEKKLLIAVVGAMALAISVNIVELACSAGLPVMFIEILSMNNSVQALNVLYIALYMIAFMFDDFLVFFIAMGTMELTGFSTKYGKVSKLVGGILLLIIGILMIFKPGWLMFNF